MERLRGCVVSRMKCGISLQGFLALLFLSFAVVCPPEVFGQAVNATLTGRVQDASGGTIGKAMVTAISTAAGYSRSVQASNTGEYTLAALPAGEYSVSAVFTGFGKQTK